VSFLFLLFFGATERLFHGWMTGRRAAQLQLSCGNFSWPPAALRIL
jgi:hypothetical protein